MSEDIAILASIIAGIFTTGAFHEDGFADVCDAFGGGWTKEKILMIMKDSRLGTYGVTGLIGILAAKFLLLKELPKFTPRSYGSLPQYFSQLQKLSIGIGGGTCHQPVDGCTHHLLF